LLSTPVFAAEPITVNSSDVQTAVVELYTSEGCSSCPPADKWLARLGKSANGSANKTGDKEIDVLALAFHVDYWDYIGWKDRFGSPAYTSRQRLLGANNSQRTIYTPEFFVNGIEARGSNTILDKIQSSNQQRTRINLKLTVSKVDNQLLLHVASMPDPTANERLHHRYFVYENNLSTDVKRGENSGELLKHQQVVRYMSPAQSLKPQNSHQIKISPDWNPQNVGVAVLVTAPGNAQYVQAVHTKVASLLSN
jgi:hypothetical protein